MNRPGVNREPRGHVVKWHPEISRTLVSIPFHIHEAEVLTPSVSDHKSPDGSGLVVVMSIAAVDKNCVASDEIFIVAWHFELAGLRRVRHEMLRDRKPYDYRKADPKACP